MTPPPGTTRREFARNVLGGLAAGALVGACGDNRDHDANDVDAGGDGACTVYPQETEGPYYLDLDMVRRDVTEGKPGTPLELVLTVVGKRASAATCAPLPGVAIDVWHCDAVGVYSGYPGQLGGLDTTGQTFLRGTQVTDADGKVTFTTIYPGWYPGRTTHIHFKVHTSATAEATSQLYFDELATGNVYATGVYASHGQKDTSNTQDGAAAGNLPPLVRLTGNVNGYTASLTITVAG